MDSLTYSYVMGTNRLDHVNDSVPAANYDVDIDNQAAGNYDYDAIGNMVKDNAEGITSISWTVYGKISKISKNSGTDIIYTYDASGNRISKLVIKIATNDTTTTWYVRDAQGNVISVYSAGDITLNSGHLSQTELHLYGSSRIGILQASVDVAGESAANDTSLPVLNKGYTFSFVRGSKLFELSNHLGNVLVTLNDKKIGVTASSGDTTIDHFIPQIVSAQDYYPFGMLQPGRSVSVSGYRFGFNGKENDNEVKGEGNQQDYGMRVYDPRLGRFLSVDPLTSKYSELTPFQFSSNSPIENVDLDGAEKISYTLTIKDNKPVLTVTNVVETYKASDGKQAQFPLTYIVSYQGSTYTFNQNSIVGGKYGNEPENTTGNLEAWFYAANKGLNVPAFNELFYDDQESFNDLTGDALIEFATGVAMAKSIAPKEGTIYEVPGNATGSGKPYVGRHNQAEPDVTRKSNDGRDRTKAKVIDRYNAGDPQEGAYKEQKAIDARGGKQNLDNKRNEVNPLRMERLEKIYGNGRGGEIRIVLPQTKQQKQQHNDEVIPKERMQHIDDMIRDHG